MICDYLQENKPIMDGLDTYDILKLESTNETTYIEHMRLMSTWGGAIEIQCACNIWNAQINVLSLQNEKVIEFIPLNGVINQTFNVSWTGGHYEPIRK
jgi:hypothetical protein